MRIIAKTTMVLKCKVKNAEQCTFTAYDDLENARILKTPSVHRFHA